MIFFIKRRVDISEASTRLRLLLVSELLSEQNIQVTVTSSLFHWYKNGDVLVMSKELSRSYIFILFLFAKICRLKLILDVCENYLVTHSKHRSNFILASKLADTIIVPSNYLRQCMNKMGFSNVEYIDDLIEVSAYNLGRFKRSKVVWFGAWRENFGLENDVELNLWTNLIYEFQAKGLTLSIITDDVFAAKNFFDRHNIEIDAIKWSLNDWPLMLQAYDFALIPNGKSEIARAKSYNRISTSLSMGLIPIVSSEWVNGDLSKHVVTVSEAKKNIDDIRKSSLLWDKSKSKSWNEKLLSQWRKVFDL